MINPIVHIGASGHRERVIGLYDFIRYEFVDWTGENIIIVHTLQALLLFDLMRMRVYCFAFGSLAVYPIFGRVREPEQKRMTVDVQIGNNFLHCISSCIPDLLWDQHD